MSYARVKSTVSWVVTMAFSSLPCPAIVKEATMMLSTFLQYELTSSLVFQILQVCCRQINKPCLEEGPEFEAMERISFIQSVLSEAMHCKWNTVSGPVDMQTPSFKKKSLDSVATVSWVCRGCCYHSYSISLKKMLTSNLSQGRKFPKSLLSCRIKYLSHPLSIIYHLSIYFHSEARTKLLWQHILWSLCGQ